MALLITGEWYEVVFFNTNDAAWGALAAPRPSIPGGLIDSIVTGASIPLYVTDAATGTFVFEGGTATGFDDTLIDSSTGPLTKNPWTTTDSVTTQYAIDSLGTFVYVYDAAAGTIRKYSAAQSAAQKAFLI